MSDTPSLGEEIDSLRKTWHDGVVPEAVPIIYEGGTSAVLLLHGFTSSPWEFRTLAAALHERGLTVYAPLLPGHGTDPDDLRKTTAQEWIDAAVDAYDELSKNGTSISVAGFSMGATLAMYLAATRKVERLLLLAPFVRIYRPPNAWISPELKIRTVGHLAGYYRKTRIGGINDLSKLRDHFAYYNVPFRALRQALKNVRRVRKLLKEITAPTLILHSKNDETVDWKGSQEIINSISSHSKRVVWFERSNHILTLDYDREEVLRYSVEFLAGKDI
ncbi:MAG: alpha/beta fold hydrolase [Syntrophaceae bacterium]|nr:alpha/beta fold hydrolase [Syntrophaceae bacterium]